MDDLDDDAAVVGQGEKPKSTRDDFSAPVRRLIAQQVGYRCSNPNCGAPTIGPAGDPDEIVNLGVGAHITAAAPKGPRFDPTLTPEQRKHQDNAIWLCQSCGKLVDSDKSTHTVAQLRQWKADAIELARRALKMRDIDPDGRLKLARETRHVAAKRVLTAAFTVRNVVREGMKLGPEARRLAFSPSREGAGYGGSVGAWFELSEATQREGEQALLDARVVWGPWDEDGPTIAIVLLASLSRCRSEFAADLCVLGGDPRPVLPPPEDPWSWSAALDGNKDHCDSINEALDRVVDAVEVWAAKFIAGRPP
jgi:hypothetical protein